MKFISAIANVFVVGLACGCGSAGAIAQVPAPISIVSPHPLTIRAEAGVLWTSRHAWSEPHRAWRLPAHGPVEHLSFAESREGGYVVTFRQGGLGWRGELGSDRRPRGPLQAIASTPGDVASAPEDVATARH